jgi:hypothetical protein
MSEKSWKGAFLSTGLPLEYTVRKTIRDLDLTTGREFSYIRRNEPGQPTEFSIAVSTSQIGMGTRVPFWVDYVSECEYRREGTKWVFIPERHENECGARLSEFFVTLDQLSDGAHINWQHLDKFSSRYQFASKGCEVF